MTQMRTQYETVLLANLSRSAMRMRDEQKEQEFLVTSLRGIDVPWETIGRTLGISKQGAQQRFSA